MLMVLRQIPDGQRASCTQDEPFRLSPEAEQVGCGHHLCPGAPEILAVMSPAPRFGHTRILMLLWLPVSANIATSALSATRHRLAMPPWRDFTGRALKPAAIPPPENAQRHAWLSFRLS